MVPPVGVVAFSNPGAVAFMLGMLVGNVALKPGKVLGKVAFMLGMLLGKVALKPGMVFGKVALNVGMASSLPLVSFVGSVLTF